MAERSTKWTFLVYPDSAPDDWQNILNNMNIPCCISPLHKPDGKGKTGEQLKAHWHIILDFGKGNYKSFDNVKKIALDTLNGVYPEQIISPIGMYEYLIHKNDPDKEQFEQGFDAITHMNGFDVKRYQQLDDEDIDSNLLSVLTIIKEYGITEFGEIVDYCLENDLVLLRYIRKNDYFINSYIRSKRGMRGRK